MNRSGLSLAILLIVALIVAFLAMSGMKSQKFGSSENNTGTENAVEQTRQLADQINQAQQRALDQLEGFNP